MNYLSITEKTKSFIKGFLTNDKGFFNIPLTFKGRGLLHFRGEGVEVNPDLINVFKNNELVYSLRDLKVSEMFGKIIFEGVDANDGFSNIMFSASEIKNMWTDSYDSKCDIWNIET